MTSRPEALETARAEVPGGTFTVCDVTDQAGVDALVSQALDRPRAHRHPRQHRRASTTTSWPAHEVDDATWDRVLAVNTTAVMRLCRGGPARHAGQRGAGAIVNIASIAGLSGGASGLAYTASKHDRWSA